MMQYNKVYIRLMYVCETFIRFNMGAGENGKSNISQIRISANKVFLLLISVPNSGVRKVIKSAF